MTEQAAPVREFTITRTFDAPRELVFDAFTDPAQMARWWGPHGLHTPLDTIAVDLRPGGAWSACMVDTDSGRRHPSGGTYREVSRPQRLAFTWDVTEDGGEIAERSVVEIDFADIGGKTRMRFRQYGFTGEQGDVREGWSQTLEKLADYLRSAPVAPRIVSRAEWLVERKALLAKEKELTRARAALAAELRGLPMVEVAKDYRLRGPQGEVGLDDLFGNARQLIVYHFMFDPQWTQGCSGCSFLADSIGEHLRHMRAANTSWVAVSRAPLELIAPFKERMGWTFPWYSSLHSDFNYDFQATVDESVAPVEVGFRDMPELQTAGRADHAYPGEHHGLSVFLRHDGKVLHSYSTYARGTENLSTTFNYLDLTPLGRQEEPGIMHWLRHHDQY